MICTTDSLLSTKGIYEGRRQTSHWFLRARLRCVDSAPYSILRSSMPTHLGRPDVTITCPKPTSTSSPMFSCSTSRTLRGMRPGPATRELNPPPRYGSSAATMDSRICPYRYTSTINTWYSFKHPPNLRSGVPTRAEITSHKLEASQPLVVHQPCQTPMQGGCMDMWFRGGGILADKQWASACDPR